MLLDEIKELNKERSGDYGHPLPNFLRISLEWSIQDMPFVHNPIGVAMKMDSLKTIRDIETTKWDNYRDKVGYINCIDLMCSLYCEMKQEVSKEGFVKAADEVFCKNYSNMTDGEKAFVVNVLKKLTFMQQYFLLRDVIDYIANKKIEGML